MSSNNTAAHDQTIGDRMRLEDTHRVVHLSLHDDANDAAVQNLDALLRHYRRTFALWLADHSVPGDGRASHDVVAQQFAAAVPNRSPVPLRDDLAGRLLFAAEARGPVAKAVHARLRGEDGGARHRRICARRARLLASPDRHAAWNRAHESMTQEWHRAARVPGNDNSKHTTVWQFGVVYGMLDNLLREAAVVADWLAAFVTRMRAHAVRLRAAVETATGHDVVRPAMLFAHDAPPLEVWKAACKARRDAIDTWQARLRDDPELFCALLHAPTPTHADAEEEEDDEEHKATAVNDDDTLALPFPGHLPRCLRTVLRSSFGFRDDDDQ